MITKFKDTSKYAQFSIAAAQQLQEEYANKTHNPAEWYNVGDEVWLDLRNIKTDWSSKKLDACQQKFRVLE